MNRFTRRPGPLVRRAGVRADFVAVPKQNPGCAMELTPKQALELWHRVSVAALKREQPHLSAPQFALLLQAYLAPPHTVRALARELAMSKPTVSRALDALGRLDFVRRKRDAADRRGVLVQRTVKGAVFLREFADLAGQAAGRL